MEVDKFITELGIYILLLNTVLFITSYNKNYKALKYFIMYLVLCCVIQKISSDISAKGDNNLYLSHYFFTGQFIFLSLFFSKILEFKKVAKFILGFTIALTVIIITYFYLHEEAYRKWSEFEIVLTSTPLLVYSFLYFLKKIEVSTSKRFIYFNSGFFVYTLCSTLIFLLGNLGTKHIKSYVWDINQLLYLFFQMAVLIEWIKNFRKQFLFRFNKNKI